MLHGMAHGLFHHFLYVLLPWQVTGFSPDSALFHSRVLCVWISNLYFLTSLWTFNESWNLTNLTNESNTHSQFTEGLFHSNWMSHLVLGINWNSKEENFNACERLNFWEKERERVQACKETVSFFHVLYIGFHQKGRHCQEGGIFPPQKIWIISVSLRWFKISLRHRCMQTLKF